MPWEVHVAADAVDCMRRLLPRGRRLAHHGVPMPHDHIRSTLDARVPGAGVELEQALLERFVEQAEIHLAPEARRHIEDGRIEWGLGRTTGAVFAARHHGLPTRAVDWTTSHHAALFFACRRYPKQDGQVWTMNLDEFEACIERQWERLGVPPAEATRWVEERFIKGAPGEWITQLQFPEYMSRAGAQGAFLTLAGALGTNHDEAITALGVRDCSLLRIPARLKQPVLEALDNVGCNGHSLHLGGVHVRDRRRRHSRRAHGSLVNRQIPMCGVQAR